MNEHSGRAVPMICRTACCEFLEYNIYTFTEPIHAVILISVKRVRLAEIILVAMPCIIHMDLA